MSKFGIDTGIAGKAMRAVGKTGTPNGLPAWVFENQSGNLGTNLNGSLIWCGLDGSLNVIPTGTTLGSAKTLSQSAGGTNYSAGTYATTCSNNMAQDLTVTITVSGGLVQTITIAAAGSGYNVGDIITIVEAGRPVGSLDAKAVITAVNNGVPVAAQSIEFKVIAGQYLPITVDYITSLTTITEADIVICK
jgi:hypothetical protein